MYVETSHTIIVTFRDEDWSDSYSIVNQFILDYLINLAEVHHETWLDHPDRKIPLIKSLRNLSRELYPGRQPAVRRHNTENDIGLGLKAARLLVEEGWITHS